MKRLFYVVVVLIAVLVALGLNLRAAHVFALMPDRTKPLDGLVSGHSGLRAGRVRIGAEGSGRWNRGRLCGLNPCWDVSVTAPDGTALAALAKLHLSGLRLLIEDLDGPLHAVFPVPSLGIVTADIAVDTGQLDLALRTQAVLAGEAGGRITGLTLEGLNLGQGPLTLAVPVPDRIEIAARLDGGPTRIEASVILDRAAGEGTVDVTFDGLDGFPPDLQRILRRVTTDADGKRHLRLRLAI